MEELKMTPLDPILIAQQIIEENAHKSRTPREVFIAEELLRLTKPLEDDLLKDIDELPHGKSCALRTVASALAQIDGTREPDCDCWKAQVKRIRAGEDSRLLDWYNAHPHAVAYATGYGTSPSGWVWRDKNKVSHDAESLIDALRAAVADEVSE